MLNGTQQHLERTAGEAGWDSFTLLLLISRWLDETGHARPLLDHLSALAAEEEDVDVAEPDTGS